MMHFMVLVLPILLFFRVEIFHFFINLSLIQWILFICFFGLCLFTCKRKISCTFIFFARNLKHFNIRKYRIKTSKWAKENNAEEIGKSLVSQLERNVFTKLGCIVLSTTIFSHYPSLLTSLKPATIFLLTLTVYSLTGLAFRKEILISMVCVYSLMAVMPYSMAFLSHNTGINLFETLPPDVIYMLNIDIFNLTQTANKLFFFTAPWLLLIILFVILSSIIVRSSLKLIFAIFLKMLQSINPA
jgi:hypothetical protein